MELPPSSRRATGSRLAGVHRANPSPPLDASSYVIGSVADFLERAKYNPVAMLLPTDEPLSPGYAEPAPEPVRSARSRDR